MGMITDFNEFKKYLVGYGTLLSHQMHSEYAKDVSDKVLYTTFITYNEETNKISSNKVSRIIASDVNSSTGNIVFCAPWDNGMEKLPTTHGKWHESSDVDMIRWELPIFTTYEEADAYRKKLWHAFKMKRKAAKENMKKNTVTLEEIADKFCINIDNLVIEGVWNDKINKKRKKI